MFVACAFGDVGVDVGVNVSVSVGIFVFHMHGGNFCDYVVVGVAQLKFKFSLFPTKKYLKGFSAKQTTAANSDFKVSLPNGQQKIVCILELLYIHDHNYRHNIKGAMIQ